MEAAPIDSALRERYLELLAVDVRVPDRSTLARLVRAHLERVPFENLSKLYYLRNEGLRTIPALPRYLDGISRLGFGGTCYSNNYYLFSLLQALGYQARFCGADMSAADVHTTIRVRLGAREWLVDVGYGAPFFDPFALDSTGDQVVALGRERFELRPRDQLQHVRLDHYRDNRLVHGYTAKPEALAAARFAAVIADSYAPDATFMNKLVMVGFAGDRALRIDNLALFDSGPSGVTRTELADREALVTAIVDRFGGVREVARLALAGLSLQ